MCAILAIRRPCAWAGLLLALATAGCTTHDSRVVGVPRAARSDAVAGYGVHHVVRPGETLWRIAHVYQVPLDELSRVNRVEDPTTLEVGRSIFVPGARAVLEIPVARTFDFDWPVRGGRVISGYGAPRRSHRHKGLDIAGRHGQAVRAARAGRVVYSGASMRGYGKTVILDHGDSLRSLYAHNSALLVRVGQWVDRGQEIARLGRSGNASADHCHFEIRRNDVAVDPRPYLAGAGTVR